MSHALNVLVTPTREPPMPSAKQRNFYTWSEASRPSSPRELLTAASLASVSGPPSWFRPPAPLPAPVLTAPLGAALWQQAGQTPARFVQPVTNLWRAEPVAFARPAPSSPAPFARPLSPSPRPQMRPVPRVPPRPPRPQPRLQGLPATPEPRTRSPQRQTPLEGQGVRQPQGQAPQGLQGLQEPQGQGWQEAQGQGSREPQWKPQLQEPRLESSEGASELESPLDDSRALDTSVSSSMTHRSCWLPERLHKFNTIMGREKSPDSAHLPRVTFEEPGRDDKSVADLKRELQVRGLDCLFCFSQEDLLQRLREDIDRGRPTRAAKV
ncbi:unnamed protein product [Effrenium voratum]|uniref:Uncharacterized protein n=1 Tax=Effrenium voratum TaxID=2562239 RepID=A0AA36IWG6_9DINO|nr:unnamed protein product [Effrenium voratum]